MSLPALSNLGMGSHSQLQTTGLNCEWMDGENLMFTPDRLILFSKLRGFLTMTTPAELTGDLQSLQTQLDDAIAAERDSLDAYVAGKVAEAVQPLQDALNNADGTVKTLIANTLNKVQAIVPSEAPATSPVISPPETAPVSPDVPVDATPVSPEVPVVDATPVAVEPEAIG